MRLIRFKFFLFATALLCVAGCMTPPVAWRYDPRSNEFASTGEALLVLPVDDRRQLQNEEKSWLNYVPFILWTTQTEQVFERSLLRNGTLRQSGAAEGIGFDAARDLQRAAAQQLGRGRKFGPVFMSKSDSGPWQGKPPVQWTLQIRLDKLLFRQTHLLYGMGPLAFVAYALGAPERNLLIGSNYSLLLYNPDGKLQKDVHVQEECSFYDGWYYSLDAEQRALDELSIMFGDKLEELQEPFATRSE